MLCTFTTEYGLLVVRSDDIRSISDGPENTLLRWDVCGGVYEAIILGTAAENRDRIQQEELELIDRVNQHHLKAQLQAQMQQQLAAQPPRVERGRQAKNV